MLKSLCLAAALLTAMPAVAQAPEPGTVQQPEAARIADRLWRTLDMAALMPVLRDEAMAEADQMQDTVFERGGTGQWRETVARIHDPARLEALFRDGLALALEREAGEAPVARLDRALQFYEGDLGRRLIGLETSARVVMLDAEAEADARAAFADAASRGEARVDQIARLIAEADLIGPNVAGGMNAAIAFSQGFADGGGFDMPLTEEQMLADAWSQEAELRAEALGWLEAYLLLAYSPLSDAELDAYIGFAASEAGQTLSAVLFGAFDVLFAQTSRDMGMAAAGQMQGREL